jgi:hypothetical protein
MLGGAVGRLQRDAAIGERGADLHDRAAVARQHACQRRQRPVNDAKIGDVGDALVLVGRHLLHRREDAEHRVVHPDVDRAECVLHRCGGVLDRVGVGDVGLQDDRLTTGGLDVALCSLEPGTSARQQPDARTAPGKRNRRRAPHAR